MFGIKYALLLSIFATALLCVESNKIKHISTTVESDLKGNVSFTCDIECDAGVGKCTVHWMKKNIDKPESQLAIAFGEVVAVPNERYSVTHQESPESYTFHIFTVEESDRAIYECKLFKTNNDVETAHTELFIRTAPRNTQIQIKPSPAELNKTVELTCASDGYPTPTTYWTRADNQFLPNGGLIHNGSVLQIEGVAAQDRGQYICSAQNGIGQPDTTVVYLEVEFPPKIAVPRPKVAQALDYNIQLECKVEGFPAPAVTWFRKGGDQITDGGSYTIISEADNNGITTSVLTVKTVEKSQYGDYICKGVNKLGTSNETVVLFESVVAVFPWT